MCFPQCSRYASKGSKAGREAAVKQVQEGLSGPRFRGWIGRVESTQNAPLACSESSRSNSDAFLSCVLWLGHHHVCHPSSHLFDSDSELEDGWEKDGWQKSITAHYSAATPLNELVSIDYKFSSCTRAVFILSMGRDGAAKKTSAA
jgi:hypothetical protein